MRKIPQFKNTKKLRNTLNSSQVKAIRKERWKIYVITMDWLDSFPDDYIRLFTGEWLYLKYCDSQYHIKRLKDTKNKLVNPTAEQLLEINKAIKKVAKNANYWQRRVNRVIHNSRENIIAECKNKLSNLPHNPAKCGNSKKLRQELFFNKKHR